MRNIRKAYVAFASLLVAVGALVALNVTGTGAQALGATGTRRDCTSEDIIYCGALSQTELLQDFDKNDGDVQAIYAHFGVKRTDLAGTTSTVKMGTLKTDGTIVVDGKTVATNAYSTYRVQTKSGAKPFTVNGKTYYMLPVNGVYYKEAEVFVMFKDGTFFQAVQSSCGNIITATPKLPPVEPVYTCDDLKSEKIDRTKFKFTPASTIKGGAEFVSYTYDFGDGKSVTDSGSTAVHTYAKAGTYTVNVKVNVKVNGSTKSVPGAGCKTTVKVEEAPVTPSYSCDSLKADKIDRTKFKFTPTATAENGAQIISYTYDFGDGKSLTDSGSTAIHTYAKPGTYTTKVSANVKVNGVTKPVTSSACKVTVKVEAVPVTPLYSCESLTAQIVKNQDRTYAYTLTYTAENGATLKNVVYNFGDSKTATYEASKATKVEHTYAKEGRFRTTATLRFTVKSGSTTVEKTKTCEVEVTISNEYCTVKGKENLPKNSPECKKIEMCTVHGKENLPKDSNQCVETPPELPKTGISELLSGTVGLGSLTTAGYYWASSRKSVISARLRR